MSILIIYLLAGVVAFITLATSKDGLDIQLPPPLIRWLYNKPLSWQPWLYIAASVFAILAWPYFTFREVAKAFNE